MTSADPQTSFFVAGGTVPPGSPSYVERAADRELYDALLAGEYAFVLNSRQMGKSSLAVRTIARLQTAGVQSAFVDLTRIGGATVTPEQWYAGLLLETGRALGLRAEAAAWLKAHREVGPAQRFLSFLNEEALTRIEGPVVLMIDEIDAVRSLPFSTDELFAGLRQLHNGRASDPALRRLTVCLLGAALPSDLVRDPRTTPFNIGRRVELRDFTPEEARPFAQEIGAEGLARLLYWTGGHPFLTQALGAALADSPSPSGSPWKGGRGERPVDALVRARYLDARARETDTNLTDVGRRLLGEGDPNVGDKERADTLSIYDRILKGKPVADDEANPSTARIKMSGVARVEDGNLKVRNRIYAAALDARWVHENMPGAELRRLKRAFWRGALRTGLVSAAVIAVVGTLAAVAVLNAKRANRAEASATKERDLAQYDAYVASMRNLFPLFQRHSLTDISNVVASQSKSAVKGWEWRYWNHVSQRGNPTRLPRRDLVGASLNPDGRTLALIYRHEIALIDGKTGGLRREIGVSEEHILRGNGFWQADRRRLVVCDEVGDVMEFDVSNGKLLRLKNLSGVFFSDVPPTVAFDGRTAIVADKRVGGRLFDLKTFGLKPLTDTRPSEMGGFVFADQGHRLFYTKLNPSYTSCEVVGRDARTFADLCRVQISGAVWSMAPSPNGKLIYVGFGNGELRCFDVATGGECWRASYAIGDVGCLRLSPDGRYMLAGSYDRSGTLIDLSTKPPSLVGTIQDFPTATAGFMLSGGTIYVAYSDHLRRYQLSNFRGRDEFRLPGNAFHNYYNTSFDSKGFLRTDDERRMLRVDSKGTAHQVIGSIGVSDRFDVDAHRWIFRFSPGNVVIDAVGGNSHHAVKSEVSVALDTGIVLGASSDGHHVVVPNTTRSVILLNVLTGHSLLLPLNSVPSCVTFSQNGDTVAIATWGTLTLWRVSDGHLIWSRNELQAGIARMAYSPDGKRLAAAAREDVCLVFDIASGRTDATLVGHVRGVYSVAWSHDGTRLVTGSGDTTVRIWDSKTGREIGIIGTHSNDVTALAFLPGGRSLASFSADGVIKLWKTEDRL